MVDTEKLSLTINELEKSSKNIVKLSDLIEQVENLANKNIENEAIIKKSLEEAINTKEQILISHELFKKSYNNLDDYITKNTEAIERNLTKINTALFETKNENSALYLRFENNVTSKIDAFKKEIIEENHKKLEELINKQNIELANKHKIILIITSLNFISILISSILLYVQNSM